MIRWQALKKGVRMLFNSFTYLLFLPLVVALHWVLPPICRRTLLLIASYIFYMKWMPSYGALILALTVANYLFGLAIEKFKKHAKAILVGGLVFNLGALCFFKYADFLITSFWHSAVWSHSMIGWPHAVPDNSPVLNILLPLGISFFTFEFIHYIVDVYRGSAAMKNFWHFALFAAFFPSQIAGPIKRFQDFTEQLKAHAKFNLEYFREGLSLIFIGLFKKMVLSDNLGHVVNLGFAQPLAMGTIDAWIAAVGFTFQIYLDFSGYTDIGRGSALLLGYKLPENFNWPFLAANLNEFWRRWHISLSTWLRDYLFIPMGGSKRGAWITKRNLFITMALGGLWHGADWHYVIWGLFHGIGLVLTKDWLELVSKVEALKKLQATRKWWHWAGVAFTFTFLIFACIIFRAPTVPEALQVMQRMFAINPSTAVVEAFSVSTLPVTLSLYVAYLWLERQGKRGVGLGTRALRVMHGWWSSSLPLRATTYASLALVIMGCAPEDVAPFIYFQF